LKTFANIAWKNTRLKAFEFLRAKYIAMARVDLLQLVINASAVMGISLCWIAFSDKASKKIWNLAFETFWSPP